MNDDDELNSFFDRQSFQFARDEEKLTKENLIQVCVFNKTVLTSSDIHGYIALKVGKKLPEGKIYLQIETVGKSCIDKAKGNAGLNEEIGKVKRKLDENYKTVASPEFKHANMRLPKLSINNQLGQVSAPRTPGTVGGEYQRTITQPRIKTIIDKPNGPLEDPIDIEYQIKVDEWEVFKLEQSIEKLTFLVLPFRISFDTEELPELLVSTNQTFSYETEELQGRASEHKAKKLAPLEMSNLYHKLKNDKVEVQSQAPNTKELQITQSKEPEPAGQKQEYVRVTNTIMAYYVTNTSFNEFGMQPLDKKVALYKTRENFCMDSSTVNIIHNFKQKSYGNWMKNCSVCFNNGVLKVASQRLCKKAPQPPKPVKEPPIVAILPEPPSSKTSTSQAKTKADRVAISPIELDELTVKLKPQRDTPEVTEIAKSNLHEPSMIAKTTPGGSTSSIYAVSRLRQLSEDNMESELPEVEHVYQSYQQPRSSGLCCTWTNKLRRLFFKAANPLNYIWVSLDKVAFNNFDETLIFVMKIPCEIAKTYSILDVTICSRSRYDVEGKEIEINKILLHDHFNLNRSIPINPTPVPIRAGAFTRSNSISLDEAEDSSKSRFTHKQTEDVLEFINRINISSLTSTYESITSPQYELKYFIHFHLSKADDHFDVQIFRKELTFFKVPEDFWIFTRETASQMFMLLEMTCDQTHDCIMLPYTNIPVPKDEQDVQNDYKDDY
jgi:hypothetical protein